MADRTAQPADGVGVNSTYSTAIFLWNGVAPTKNQINAATATPKGTNTSGSDGQFQYMSNTDGAMSWSITPPATTYTLVLGLVFPDASRGPSKLIAIPSGNFRLETYTTGGGVYLNYIHTGSAAAAAIVTGVGGFDTQMWTYVLRYNGTSLISYLKRGDDSVMTTTTETLGYSNTGSAAIEIGDTAGGNGIYAAILIPSDIGDTEAQALRDNIWRAFAPEGGGSSAGAAAHYYSQL